MLWEDIGSVLLEVLQARLRLNRLHPQPTHGVLVLLAKKGDPMLVNNKRGLTLLNCTLKILIKLYQLGLSLILQSHNGATKCFPAGVIETEPSCS